MTEMIAQYDFQAQIDSAVQQEMARVQLEQNNQNIEKLILQLGKAMKDQKRIVQLWPNAQADTPIFSHLELKFDLDDGKVTTTTAAKDFQGNPLFKHVLDMETESSISFTGTDVTHYKVPTQAASPEPQVTSNPVPPQPQQYVTQKPVVEIPVA